MLKSPQEAKWFRLWLTLMLSLTHRIEVQTPEFRQRPLALRQITLQLSGPRHVAESSSSSTPNICKRSSYGISVSGLETSPLPESTQAFRLESSARSVTSLPGIGAGTASEHEEPLQAVASTGLTAERSSASLQDKERGRSPRRPAAARLHVRLKSTGSGHGPCLIGDHR